MIIVRILKHLIRLEYKTIKKNGSMRRRRFPAIIVLVVQTFSDFRTEILSA